MRVFITQLFHEASSFIPIEVKTSDFKKRHYLKGFESVRDTFKNESDWVNGSLEPFISNGDEIDIGVCTACLPGGMIEYDSFVEIKTDIINEFSDYLQRKGAPDIVMMLLHGANLVAGMKDPDGHLVEMFRGLLGNSNTIIGITLDFHANISEKLVNLSDVVIVGKEYPHVDTYNRGKLASELAREMSIGGRKWQTLRFPIPIISALPNQATVENLPFYKIMNKAKSLEIKYNIKDLAISGGFAFGDCYDLGMNLLATNNETEVCKKALGELSDLIWELKDEILKPIPQLSQVWPLIDKKSKFGRIIVADVSDSPGSGGSADETHLLSKLLTSSSEFVSAFHVDPTVVQKAIEIGEGNIATFKFGTALSHSSSRTLELRAKVSKILDYEYVNIGNMMKGARLHGGLTSVLQVENGSIVVTTERIQPYDINAFLRIGLDISIKRPLIIAIKSTAHFRSSYTALADQGIVLVDCDGWSNPNFHNFEYKNRKIPLLPLERMTKEEWDSNVLNT
ncbi:uncharacterized protein PRCAT00002973001 [Priceomyces carsonii]|uniref:uncharacterized protein n=1 Tax=Priceomyces carsonii TaxID=28549 RepID=UPI002ED7BAB5|nr:unnamed protein product [Priceomyces carsonii]